MAPKEQIKLDFKDDSKHLVLFVRRDGMADDSGPLGGGAVVESGVHDIVSGGGGDPRGYLEITAPSGDVACIGWTVSAVFVPGEGGKPRLLDNGVWELVGDTSNFAGMKGVGILHIKPTTPTDRRFILDGDLVTAP